MMQRTTFKLGMVATAMVLADEIWLTNALMGLVPVRHWREQAYPAPGALCLRLQMSYHDDIKTKN